MDRKARLIIYGFVTFLGLLGVASLIIGDLMLNSGLK